MPRVSFCLSEKISLMILAAESKRSFCLSGRLMKKFQSLSEIVRMMCR